MVGRSASDVYLYELALELGEKSLDLAQRARGLGVADAGPNSSLTPAQVAAIRSGIPVAAAAVAAAGPATWSPPGVGAPPPHPGAGPLPHPGGSLPPPPGAGTLAPPPGAGPASLGPYAAPGASAGPAAPGVAHGIVLPGPSSGLPTWAKVLIGLGVAAVVGFAGLVGLVMLGQQAESRSYRVGPGGRVAASDTDEGGFTEIEMEGDIGDDPANEIELCVSWATIQDFQQRVTGAGTWEAARDIVMKEYEPYGRALERLAASSSHDNYVAFGQYRDTLDAGLGQIRLDSPPQAWALVDVTKIFVPGSPDAAVAETVEAEIGAFCP